MITIVVVIVITIVIINIVVLIIIIIIFINIIIIIDVITVVNYTFRLYYKLNHYLLLSWNTFTLMRRDNYIHHFLTLKGK